MCAGPELIDIMDTLKSEQRRLGWGLGAVDGEQLSKQAKTPALIRLYHLLLFTMPGTPVFTYGDEIGLQSAQASSIRSAFNVRRFPVWILILAFTFRAPSLRR